MTRRMRIRQFMSTRIFVFVLAPFLGVALVLGVLRMVNGQPPLRAPFEMSNYFYPSGWMGDGEKVDGKAIDLNDQWKENCHSAPTCIRIIYHPDNKGWAGIYWQYPDGNWGDYAGRLIEGAKKISFWVRGEKGGELVQFKAGGISDQKKKYHDSFEKAVTPIKLENEWRRYEIDLTGSNLTSVIGAFAWIANKKGNPEGLTFYLDDICYE